MQCNVILILISILLMLNSGLLAQGDNPRIDALPLEWIQNINYKDAESDIITASDGFDNFNMGVDLAEPHISQNPLNPLQYFGAYNINGAWRTSDGHDWKHFTPPFSGFIMRGDPVTAYDGGGRVYYENMYGTSILGCKVIVSTNNGQTWSSPATSIAGSDKNWMAADQTDGPYSNYVYTTMTRSSYNGHGFARTTNNGSSWSTTFNATNSPLPGAMVCVGPNGTTNGGAVYFVTNSGSTFASTYTFYLSTNGGASFTLRSTQFFAGYVGTNVSRRHSVENMRTRPYPFIAADNSNSTYRGRLYCIYASNDPPGNGNKPDIWCRYSTNMGSSWSSAIKVNDDASTQNHHQWHPSIWCDTQTGRLFAKWMDTRDTPTSDYAYIYASYSDNGGVTWVTNQRISNEKMKIDCITCGGGGTPRYQGDYDAIVSINNQALAMWTDFRDNNFGSYVGYFPDFAMQVSPSSVAISSIDGSAFVTIDVPAVKLFSQDVIFSADVTPISTRGTIRVDFPLGNTMSTFPGEVDLRVRTIGSVTLGSYTINIQGEGPNGTPVHRRTVKLTVEDPVPVELASFNGIFSKGQVLLNWETATEVDNYGFDIMKRVNGSAWKTLGFVEGNGNTNSPRIYSFTDRKLFDGAFFNYRLKQIDTDGKFEYSKIIEIEINPNDFVLYQNYPNPFNSITAISYQIPETGLVTLKIYDVLGKKVAILVNENKEAGNYQVNYDATKLTSGIYFYRMQTENFVDTKNMILVK
ncbi:T9SS type A sorting domain-containing protein [Bacteroidota bacterium]